MNDDDSDYGDFAGAVHGLDVDRDPALESEALDLSNPATLKKSRDKQRREREKAEAFWRAVMADVVGRQEMWNLLQSAHAFEERFACSPTGFPDPNATWFHAGEQSFGQRLFLSLLKMAPDGVQQMLNEHHNHFQKPKRASTSQ